MLSVSFGKANALENASLFNHLVFPGDSVRIWGTTFGLAEASTTGGSGRRRDIHHCITLREFWAGKRIGKAKDRGKEEGKRKRERKGVERGRKGKGERGRERDWRREGETALQKIQRIKFQDPFCATEKDEVYQQTAKGILSEERDFSPARRKK